MFYYIYFGIAIYFFGILTVWISEEKDVPLFWKILVAIFFSIVWPFYISAVLYQRSRG